MLKRHALIKRIVMDSVRSSSPMAFFSLSWLIILGMGFTAPLVNAQADTGSYRATRHIPIYRAPDFEAERAGVFNCGTRVPTTAVAARRAGLLSVLARNRRA